jgi:hypothetical protein
MARRSAMTLWGIPILIGVLILVVAIARVGATDNNNDERDPNLVDGYLVELVTIEEVEVLIAESYPVQVFVRVTGYLPDPCWEALPPTIVKDGNRIEIEILARRDPEAVCAQVIQDYEESIPLGTMDPGEYVVSVNGVEREFEVH